MSGADDLSDAQVELLVERGATPGATTPPGLADHLALDHALRALLGQEAETSHLLQSVQARLRASPSVAWRQRLGSDLRRRRRPAQRHALPLILAAAALVLVAIGLRWSVQPAVTAGPSSPIVRLISGSADGLAAGAAVPAGAGLATPTGCVLAWADGSRITCDPGSRISAIVSDRIDLAAGGVACEITPRQPGGRFEVRTDHCRTAVKGTAFRVVRSPAATVVQVTAGRVEVSAISSSVTHPLDPGMRLQIGTDGVAWASLLRLAFPEAAGDVRVHTGRAGMFAGEACLLAGDLDGRDGRTRQLRLSATGGLLRAPAAARLNVRLALDRATSVRLWVWDREAGHDLSAEVPVPGDGAYHDLDVPIPIAAGAVGHTWDTLLLLCDDSDTTLAVTRLEVLGQSGR